jgi:hypothetical protein
VIGAMQEVVHDMLKEFHRRNNGIKPQALIYYRDGVADSQFPTVLEHEYTAFRKVRRASCAGERGGGCTHTAAVFTSSQMHSLCTCCMLWLALEIL